MMAATRNPVVVEAERLAQAHGLRIYPRRDGAGNIVRYAVYRRADKHLTLVGRAVSPSALLMLVRRSVVPEASHA